MKKIYIFCFLLFGIGIMSCAMHNQKNTEVSFYLVKNSLFKGHKFDLSEVILDESPVFTTKDIIEYSQNDHTIKITKEAYKKWCALPAALHYFAICLDNNPVYWGIVRSPYWDVGMVGVSVIEGYRDYSTKDCDGCNEIQIEYNIIEHNTYSDGTNKEGYDDPRQNKLILDSLRKSNKLVETISKQKALEIAKIFFLEFNYGPHEEYRFTASKRGCENWTISYTSQWEYISKGYNGAITVNRKTGETKHIWTSENKIDG